MTDQIAFGVQEDFKEGWSVLPFSGTKAHYWIETINTENDSKHFDKIYNSLCGRTGFTREGVSHLNVGSFEKCKNCQNIADKKGSSK